MREESKSVAVKSESMTMTRSGQLAFRKSILAAAALAAIGAMAGNSAQAQSVWTGGAAN